MNLTSKKCKICDVEKPLNKFGISRIKKDGTVSRKPICMSCKGKIYVKIRCLREGREYIPLTERRARVDVQIKSGTKQCSRCKILKPLDNFYRDKRCRAFRSYCKACCLIYGKENYKHKPHKIITEEMRLQRKLKQRQQTRERNKERYKNDKEYRNKYIIARSVYNTTVRKRRERYRRELTDQYLKNILQKIYSIRWSEFTPEILQELRTVISTRRLLRQLRKEI